VLQFQQEPTEEDPAPVIAVTTVGSDAPHGIQRSFFASARVPLGSRFQWPALNS
jgi:fructose-specific phosphotransferase system IIC component